MSKKSGAVYMRLNGGLGNQLFQLAAGLFLSIKFERDLILDSSGLDFLNSRRLGTPRNLGLDALYRNLNIDRVRMGQHFGSLEGSSILGTLLSRASGVAQTIRTRPSHIIESRFFSDLERIEGLSKSTYVSGYWQDFKYANEVRNELRQMRTKSSDFPQEVQLLGDEIALPNRLVVHIRRGDFTARRNRISVINKDYFAGGIEYFLQRGVKKIFFFSEDPNWCRKEYAYVENATFVEPNHSTPGYDLWAMSRATNFLISNSTFSMWAAWLSEESDKEIVRPSSWIIGSGRNPYPHDWKTLNNSKESLGN